MTIVEFQCYCRTNLQVASPRMKSVLRTVLFKSQDKPILRGWEWGADGLSLLLPRRQAVGTNNAYSTSPTSFLTPFAQSVAAMSRKFVSKYILFFFLSSRYHVQFHSSRQKPSCTTGGLKLRAVEFLP